MLAQIELTQVGAEALAQLEQSTGESRTVLIDRALEQYLQSKEEEAELLASIEQGRADFLAGRVHSSAEMMASVMATIAETKHKKNK